MNRAKIFYSESGTRIEYSKTGTGIPVLLFHGGHSDCNDIYGYSELLNKGYTLVVPSRAGYGQTSPNTNLKAMCRAYVELLNALNIERVHVIAVSAGGPSGIYFVSHYPDRVRSLSLQSAVTKEWLRPTDKQYKVARFLFHPSTEKFTWTTIRSMNRLFPSLVFRFMSSSLSTLPYSQIQTLMNDHDIQQFRKMTRQRSKHGFMIDVSQTNFIHASNLHEIRCPTLILHSRYDRAVPLEHAFHAHKNIPHSELCVLETWGHLIWLGKGSKKFHETLLDFLGRH